MIASGRFTVPLSSSQIFDECGVIIEDGELIITRSVTSDGKSKATSNGLSVTASTLASVSQLLVEVHAQAANIHISKSARQRELLDRYAGSDFNVAMGAYSGLLGQYHELKSRITVLKKSMDKVDQELAELREFASELTKLTLEPGNTRKSPLRLSAYPMSKSFGSPVQRPLARSRMKRADRLPQSVSPEDLWRSHAQKTGLWRLFTQG